MTKIKILSLAIIVSMVVFSTHYIVNHNNHHSKNIVQLKQLEKKYDQPDRAALWLSNLRKTPNSNDSASQLNNQLSLSILKNEKSYKNNKATVNTEVPTLNFENLGPSNFGGRIRVFVIKEDDEKQMLAGSVSGGVFKSENGGKSWFGLNGFLPSLTIGSMVTDPDDTNRVFIGTGEGFFNVDSVRGAGIFISEDFGENWTQLSSTNNENFYYVNRLVKIPNSQVLIAATWTGIFRSEDLGETWNEVSSQQAVGRGFVDLKLNPSNTNHLYAVHYGFPNDALKLIISTPNSIAGSYDAIPAGFGPDFPDISISNLNVVLVNDNTATTNDGCESIVNDISGKIALIQRGSCNFTVKVKNAQLAGASAVIVYQNLSDAPFTMGGSDETITIPSAMISQADGVLIVNATGPISGKVEPVVNAELSRYVMQSIDAGRNWVMLNNSNGLPESNIGRMELAFGTDGVCYVAVANADDSTRGLWKSEGLDRPFVKMASDTAFIERQGWYDLAIAVHPTDSDTVFMGAVDQYITHDGGSTITRNSTWAPDSTRNDLGVDRYVHADHHGYFFSPTNPNHHFIVSDGGVFKTENNGQSFFSMNDGLSISQSYGIAVNGSATKVTSGTQDNGSQLYFGDSNSWIEWFGGDGGFSAWDAQNDAYLYGSTPNGGLFGSKNNGANPQSITLPDTDGALFIQPFALDPNNGNRMVVGTDNVFYSSNIRLLENASFIDISGNNSSGSISSITFNPVLSNQVLYGLSNGTLFKIDNVGTTNQVTEITPTAADNLLSNEGTITDIKIDQNDSSGNTLFITRANYDKDRVLMSTDGGSSWQSIAGDLPDIPVFQITLDPSDNSRVFIGSELGLWVANINGENTHWFRYDYGVAFTRVIDLVWQGETLFIATHGRGTYKATRDAIEVSLNNFITTSSTNDTDGILDRGESGLLMVQLKNNSGISINNAQIDFDAESLIFIDGQSQSVAFIPAHSSVVLPVNVLLSNDANCQAAIDFNIEVNHSGLNSHHTFNLLTAANQALIQSEFKEDAESNISNMKAEILLGQSNWTQVQGIANQGTHSWFASNENNYSDKTLTSPWLTLDSGGNVLTFSLKYLTEGDAIQLWDGAVLEIREQGGLWMDIGHLSTVPYDGQLFTNNTIQGRFAWSGSHDTWRNAVVDLEDNYQGKTIQFRFRMVSDSNTSDTGFWVDDIQLTHVFEREPSVCDELVSTESKVPYSGLWYDRAHNGHGFVIEPVGQGDQYFTVFYSYDDLGNPEWYTSISTLENGILNVNFDADSLLRSLYDFNVDPNTGTANYLDPNFNDGRLRIDFNSTNIESNAACQDGQARGVDKALARWKINNEEKTWCLEPIVAEANKGFPNLGGTWFAGAHDSGWGFSIAQTTTQLVVVIYFYDSNGNPRWMIGQKDGFEVGNELSIDMLQVNGYGRTDTPIATSSISAGTVQITLNNALNNLDIDGNVKLNIEYQGTEGGSWVRENIPVQLLSKSHE